MLKKTAEAYAKTNVDALSNSVAFLEELQQAALKDNNKKLALEIQKELNRVLELSKEAELNVKIEGITINIKKPDDE